MAEATTGSQSAPTAGTSQSQEKKDGVDIEALADRVYRLMLDEGRLARDRGFQHRRRRGR